MSTDQLGVKSFTLTNIPWRGLKDKMGKLSSTSAPEGEALLRALSLRQLLMYTFLNK